MTPPSAEQCVELLCQKGCKEVLRLIGEIEEGGIPEELAHLPETGRQAVLRELKAIMAAYDHD
jgi:hypothetical protein